jgi:photosystem II stability/assembly factor-like uncharacterized protein
MDVTWLGDLPSDEYYSTRLLSLSGDQGVAVTEDTVLGSDDGGRNWKVKAKKSEVPGTISDAWLGSSNRLFLLSGGTLFESSDLGPTWKPMDTVQDRVSYLAITGDRTRKRVVLVGEKSVSITRTQLAELPKYAQDSSSSSPSMVVPAISISSDEGRTWRSIQLPKAVGYLDGVKISGAYGVAWGPHAVYASTDGGISWKLMNMDVPGDEEEAYPVSAAITAEKFRISLKNGRILAGSITGHNLSTIAQLHAPLGHLIFFDQCTGFGVTSEGGLNTGREDALVKTEDGGITWNQVLNSKKIVALSSGASDLYGATADRVFRIAVIIGKETGSCAR